MDRILVLMASADWADAEKALRSAHDNAAGVSRISYGLSLASEPGEEDAAAMRTLGSIQYLAPAGDPWQDMPALWQGEGFVLVGHPAMRFTRHWDIQLLRAIRQCQRSEPISSVLTGYLPRPIDPVDAISPVAAESFDDAGRLCFHRGTPLRYARAPLRSAFLHPDFCFAPAAFFQEMTEEDGPRFLAAFRRKWDVFTLHRPLIHMAWDTAVPPCAVDATNGRVSGLSRLEKRFGLKIDARQLSAMSRLGVFTSELVFPTRVPLPVRAQEAVREMVSRTVKVNPLCVTAFLTLPVPSENLPEEYMTWFGYLCAMKSLSLLGFADGDMLRRIMPAFPNVLEFKRRYGLPVQTEIRPEDALNFLKLSKPFILAQSREKFLSHSHYAWIDFGYLRYPVYERAALDWATLCGDRIVLATVGGAPDTSMIIIPDARVKDVCRETTSLCEQSLAQRGALMEETALWQTLLQEHPDWFAPIDLPKRRELLMLTMLSREEEFHVLA